MRERVEETEGVMVGERLDELAAGISYERSREEGEVMGKVVLVGVVSSDVLVERASCSVEWNASVLLPSVQKTRHL